MDQDFFLVWIVSSVIGVACFGLSAPDLCFGNFEIHGRLIDENDEINQFLLEQVLRQEAGCSWRGAVLSRHYSRS